MSRADPVCVQCGKKREGRWARPKGSAGYTVPNWWCYVCLPEGMGRGEEDEVPVKASPKPQVGLVRIDPTKVRTEGMQLITPLKAEAQELEVVDAESYLVADQLLHRIIGVRKTWKDRMEKIIRPQRQAIDALYELNRDVDRPLEAQETAVRHKMKTFKLEEQRQIQAAEQAQRAEQERLQREAEEAQRKAERAATPQMAGRLRAKAEAFLEKAEEVAQEEAPTPVIAASSTTRPKKVVTLDSFEKVIMGIADGDIPLDCVEVNWKRIREYFKDDPAGVESWPGFKVIDDIQIVGR